MVGCQEGGELAFINFSQNLIGSSIDFLYESKAKASKYNIENQCAIKMNIGEC